MPRLLRLNMWLFVLTVKINSACPIYSECQIENWGVQMYIETVQIYCWVSQKKATPLFENSKKNS